MSSWLPPDLWSHLLSFASMREWLRMRLVSHDIDNLLCGRLPANPCLCIALTGSPRPPTLPWRRFLQRCAVLRLDSPVDPGWQEAISCLRPKHVVRLVLLQRGLVEPHSTGSLLAWHPLLQRVHTTEATSVPEREVGLEIPTLQLLVPTFRGRLCCNVSRINLSHINTMGMPVCFAWQVSLRFRYYDASRMTREAAVTLATIIRTCFRAHCTHLIIDGIGLNENYIIFNEIIRGIDDTWGARLCLEIRNYAPRVERTPPTFPVLAKLILQNTLHRQLRGRGVHTLSIKLAENQGPAGAICPLLPIRRRLVIRIPRGGMTPCKRDWIIGSVMSQLRFTGETPGVLHIPDGLQRASQRTYFTYMAEASSQGKWALILSTRDASDEHKW